MVVKVELDEDAAPSAVTVDRIDGMRCTGNNHHTVTECTNLRVECFRFCGGVAFTGTGMPASRASDCSATGTAVGRRGAGGPVSLELTPHTLLPVPLIPFPNNPTGIPSHPNYILNFSQFHPIPILSGSTVR